MITPCDTCQKKEYCQALQYIKECLKKESAIDCLSEAGLQFNCAVLDAIRAKEWSVKIECGDYESGKKCPFKRYQNY